MNSYEIGVILQKKMQITEDSTAKSKSHMTTAFPGGFSLSWIGIIMQQNRFNTAPVSLTAHKKAKVWKQFLQLKD
jgi:hypothetical protein